MGLASEPNCRLLKNIGERGLQTVSTLCKKLALHLRSSRHNSPSFGCTSISFASCKRVALSSSHSWNSVVITLVKSTQDIAQQHTQIAFGSGYVFPHVMTPHVLKIKSFESLRDDHIYIKPPRGFRFVGGGGGVDAARNRFSE